jgi:hypothetical protein
MAEKIPMGIGALGFSNLVFKKQHRFTFELFNICGNKTVPAHYVKKASRPNLDIDEVELNYLNATTWMPGKAKWQTMNVSYYDVATADAAPLFSWLASVYNLTNPVTLEMGSARSDYTATGVLKIWDGCGSLIETWTMSDMWPTNIDFGEVAYESSEICTIELTLRYSQVQYTPTCPTFPIEPCCTPCGQRP